ncbi:MAG TPA: PKD domain-containing protein [Thermoplasmata archaeon]|nr:PKD domain-containing protein [Thermoplasmata archaeon]
MSQRPIWGAAALTILVLAAALALGSFSLPLAPAQSGTSPRPNSSGFTASPNPDDVGVTATFDASGLCKVGLTGCSYSYSGLPAGCSTANSPTLGCTPSASGQTTVNVTAIWGCPVCLSSSSTLSFTVNPDPVVASISATPTTVDAGELLAISVSVTGGTAPFGYAWSGLPAGCSSLNASVLSCRPSASGTSTVGVSVRDAAGGQTSGSLPLTVNPRLGAVLAVTPSVRDLGGSVMFATTISGGQPPYSMSYSGLPSGCASSDASTLPCTPGALGSYQVTVTVGDAVGGIANATAALQVVPSPTVTVTVSPTTVDLGQSATFQVTVNGGSGSYGYRYSNLPSGCASSNTSALRCTPTAPGTFAVAVAATDSEGNGATGTASLTVNPALAAAISANVSSGFTPLAVAFSSVVSGGTAPFVYAWQFAPNARSNLSDPQHVFVSGGNFSVSLTVTDAAGASITVFYPVSVRSSATYVTYPIGFFVNPPGCGPITLNSVLQADGSTAPLPKATFNALAPSCPGFAFTQWVPSGGILIGNAAARSTNVTVTSSGSLTAVFGVVVTHGHGPPGGSSLKSFSSWAPYLPLLVGGGVALFLIKGFFDRRSPNRRPPSRTDRTGALGPSSIGGSRPPPPPAPAAGRATTSRLERLSSQVPERLRQALGRLPRTEPAGAANGRPSESSGVSDPLGFTPSFVSAPTEPLKVAPGGSPVPVRASPTPVAGNGESASARFSVASWIPPPPTRVPTRLGPVAPSPSGTPQVDPPDLSVDRRSWPPSGIWEMAPTPNTPKKRIRDAGADEP